MTCYRAKIMTSFKQEDEPAGILQCLIPSTQFEISPSDFGLEDAIVPVIYTTPYSFHGDGGIIAIPPDGTNILVEKIGKHFYYLTSIVGPDPGDVDELTEDTAEEVVENFSCETDLDPIYSKSMGFPDTIMLRHPKGHLFQMKDDVPLETDKIKPARAVHNSKIEMKSASGKIVSLDDGKNIDALRMGIANLGRNKDEYDGIIIGHNNGLTGPRCIKIQAKNNISTTTDSGDIINRVVDGNKFSVENTSTGMDGKMSTPIFGFSKPQVNMGTEFGDINLVAGNNEGLLADPLKAKLGPSKIIIEALGESRIANWIEEIPPPPMSPPGTPGKQQQMSAPVLPPIVRITSDGNIEIISQGDPLTSGKIHIQATGDINIGSTLGSVNIKSGPLGVINLNGPLGIIPTKTSLLPTSPPFGLPAVPSLRGYVPYGWIMPFTVPI